MGLALVVYLRTIGEEGAAVWAGSAGSAGSYGGCVVYGG